MAEFKREYRSGGNRSFGKPRFNNDRPDMHKATCANCGKTCEVPFRPTGSKPVFCRECFKNNNGSDSRGAEKRSFDPSHKRQMHDAVCSKCGEKCQIPFRPRPDREVFCSRCFEKNENAGAERSFEKPEFNRQSRADNTPNIQAQFAYLNAKLDKILNLLTPAAIDIAPHESVIDEKVIDEIAEEIEAASPEVIQKITKTKLKKTSVKAKKPSPVKNK